MTWLVTVYMYVHVDDHYTAAVFMAVPVHVLYAIWVVDTFDCGKSETELLGEIFMNIE